jgi:alpha-ketoglutarate-dependent taurine dioxygenase
VVGVGWAEAFGLNDPADVERYCRDNDIEFLWDAEGGLRTRRQRHAIVYHPSTGKRVWFNQIAFLNEWTMDPAIREFLVREFGPDGLPFNTRFGDGDPVDKATVDVINEIYAAHTVRAQWRAGDLLLVDNIRTAHGRESYEGTREVLVGMADPVLLSECGPPVGR